MHKVERWGLALCVLVYDTKLREGFAAAVALFFKHLAKTRGDTQQLSQTDWKPDRASSGIRRVRRLAKQ